MEEQEISSFSNRILCVGTDRALLETRRLLLLLHGYEATVTHPGAADETLLASGFGLVILSLSVDAAERSRILALLPAATHRLVLDAFVMPAELLGMIKRASL